jgi:hypothetical protein
MVFLFIVVTRKNRLVRLTLGGGNVALAHHYGIYDPSFDWDKGSRKHAMSCVTKATRRHDHVRAKEIVEIHIMMSKHMLM